ncbi:MAG: CHAT domain-containing protein [Myxococcales bacterium]|nr:MAG: CHAT domain-containing protein [Myxococcales bacterium]
MSAAPLVFRVPSRGPSSEGRVEATTRSTGQVVDLKAVPYEDIVELELVNGPTLVMHPEHARELLVAHAGPSSNRERSDGSIAVPTRLGWNMQADLARSRGLGEAGQVLLHAFRVIAGAGSSQGAELATGVLGRAIDARATPGLWPLQPTTVVSSPQAVQATGKKLLVLLHGTFSTTLESFGALWKQPGLLESLRRGFDLYAFDHATLQKSPLQNALELVEALPEGASVSFLTHSRGGLIAEALAHVAEERQPLAPAAAARLGEEDFRAQLPGLRELQEKVRQRGIKVDRIVRVACPTRGTLLASERLDVYLSVLQWGLQLAQIPVAKELVSFLHEVAKRRTSPKELPGLEAMMPESAFVRWLNHSEEELPGDLRIVAGDTQGDSLASWLTTLVSDAFFWTDNDLVVQTRSMYGGRPRLGGSTYFLERGGKISHFGYFSNPTTAQAVARALTDDAPEGFHALGQLSRAGLSSSGSRGGVKGKLGASLSKPAVIVLPGILGSELSQGDHRLWLGLRIINGLPKLAWSDQDGIEATGWIGPFYDGLARHLSESHEVIPHPFDWRRPIEQEAEGLATVLRDAMAGRTEPVRILAHSHGGLVARTVEKVAPDVWQTWMKNDRSRLVMLGTPNGGSWAPMQVLSGDNLIGNLVTYVGTLFDESKARALFASLPGFIQLQAGMLDEKLKLYEAETWEALARADASAWGLSTLWHHLPIQRRALDWGRPSQAELDRARQLREWLAAQDLQSHGNRVIMVVGKADQTPSGFEVGMSRFEYLQTERGDGTVTHADALIPGVKAFQVAVEHSWLPIPSELYPGYLNLLEDGTPHDADHFSGITPTRGGSASSQFATEPPRRAIRRRGWSDAELDLVPTLSAQEPLGESTRTLAPALEIAVTNGDLTFVSQPLLLGHYRSLTLTGAESKVDEFLGGTMTLALRLRGYATQLNEARYFKNQRPNPADPHQVPRPSAVVVVGLGPEGELRAEALTATVRQGVINHAVKLAGERAPGTSFELAVTLIGSGGLGMAVATSARAIAQGVYAANQRLLEQGAPIVAKLEFIEIYEDRATEALRELHEIAAQRPACFKVEPWLKLGRGGLIRPLTSSYRGADYDMVSVMEGADQDGVTSTVFTLDSRRARAEVRSTTTQLPLLQALIDQAEADPRSDAQLGKTLFRILVPSALDSFFGGSDGVLLQLDRTTAAVPWELLSVDSDEDEAGDKPWSVRSKLVRKLQTRDFRERPLSAGQEAKVLVIGDPFIDDQSQYPQLPGAVREARAVASALGLRAGPLLNAGAIELVNALLAEDLSILHIAGHGREDGSGVVLSGGLVLNADIVKSMRRLPDLVFVNTCHSARERVGELPARAATLARALIDAGVRCVIATGWAVDDDAAEHFALKFYEGLRQGLHFMNATAMARSSTYEHCRHSNTWAAYQCYGDPGWVWSRHAPESSEPDRNDAADTKQRDRASPRPEPESPIISLSGLLVAVDTFGATEGGDKERARALARLRALELEMQPRLGERGEVAEALGAAFRNLGDRQAAIRWYEKAVRTERGATFGSLEQLFNLKVRRSADDVEKALLAWELAKEGADGVESAREALRQGVEAATTAFEAERATLNLLAALPETSERFSMVASAWKRRAMTDYAKLEAFGDEAARQSSVSALEESQRFYEQSAQIAAKEGSRGVAYPRLNAMTAQLVRELLLGHRLTNDQGAVQEVRDSLTAWAAEKRDFWPYVQAIEVELYAAVLQQSLSSELARLLERFKELWTRIADLNSWGSVSAQARFLLRPYRRALELGGTLAPENSAAEAEAARQLTKRLHEYSQGRG